MTAYLRLPFDLLHFWYAEAPRALIEYFFSLNRSCLDLFSVSLLLKTFFKPIKGEYRDGLVGFSIGMGIVVKTSLLLMALITFLCLLILEILFFLGFLAFPIFTVIFLFE